MVNIINKYFYKYPKFDNCKRCNEVFKRNYYKYKVCKSCEDYLVSPEASSLERTLNLTSK
jgi:formylmethanofuran dehydrogenase subunit E